VNNDLDLERVVSDPDYRRKAIEDLKRAELHPDDEIESGRRSKTGQPVDSERDDG